VLGVVTQKQVRGQGRWLNLCSVDEAGQVVVQNDHVKILPTRGSTKMIGVVCVSQQPSVVIPVISGLLAAAEVVGVPHQLLPCPTGDQGLCLKFWDIAPTDNTGDRVSAVALCGAVNDDNKLHAARLLASVINCCSTVVFAYENDAQMTEWFTCVGPSLPPTGDVAFNTVNNTMDMIFAAQDESSEFSPLSKPFIVDGAAALRNWVVGATNDIVGIPINDVVPRMCAARPYRLPGRIDPLVTVTFAPSYLLQMMISQPANWDVEIMKRIAQDHLDSCHAFYHQAMQTELMDQYRKSDPNGRAKPISSEQLVTLHNHFFFAALRKFTILIEPLCGRDVSATTALLELMKRDVNNSLRTMWRQNQDLSRSFCTELFEKTFAPLKEKYLRGQGFQEGRRPLKVWFNAVRDKISEYNLKAVGPRQFDVLWDRVSELCHDTMEAVQSQIDSGAPLQVHVDDLKLACRELTHDAEKRLQTFRAEQDAILGRIQRDTAVYTSYVGNDWSATIYGHTVDTLRQMRSDVDLWSHRCVSRMRRVRLLRDDDEVPNWTAVRSDAILRATENEGTTRMQALRLAVQLQDAKQCAKEFSVIPRQRSVSPPKVVQMYNHVRQWLSSTQ
jgi:hypothetical protein